MALATVLKSLPKVANYPYLFSLNGKPVKGHGWLRDDFKAACRFAAIENCPFKDLQKTFGTLMGNKRVNEKIVADMLGHRSTRVTERYIRSISETHERAVQELSDRVMGQPDANGNGAPSESI